MEKQVQYFQIANLIFASPENQTTVLNGKEMDLIQERFKSIVKSFESYDVTHYATGFKGNGTTNLPYNSMVLIGRIGERLILHFTFSYKNPVLLIINTETNTAQNYINIESAKDILDEDTYEDMKAALQYPKRMDNLFRGISDINKFIQKFEELLQKHENPNAITGRDCFEVDLETFDGPEI